MRHGFSTRRNRCVEVSRSCSRSPAGSPTTSCHCRRAPSRSGNTVLPVSCPGGWRPSDDGRGVRLQLSETAESLKAYPFRFLLSMEVRLAPSALEISTTVTKSQ